MWICLSRAYQYNCPAVVCSDVLAVGKGCTVGVQQPIKGVDVRPCLDLTRHTYVTLANSSRNRFTVDDWTVWIRYKNRRLWYIVALFGNTEHPVQFALCRCGSSDICTVYSKDVNPWIVVIDQSCPYITDRLPPWLALGSRPESKPQLLSLPIDAVL